MNNNVMKNPVETGQINSSDMQTKSVGNKSNNSWFNVNHIGLKKNQSDKNKIFIIKELVSNAFDENINKCEVQLTWSSEGTKIKVQDDSPEGFKKLADAYTLFNESYKANDTSKRGRFSYGTKSSLAMFKEAKIVSTKGTILFKSNGTRTKTGTKTEKGSIFEGLIKLKKVEFEELLDLSRTIIPPKNVEFVINDNLIKRSNTHSVFTETLPTVTIDEEGNFTPSSRVTEIELFKSLDTNYICELGIPVVETDIPFTINVNQKVPLSKDRDNVKPAYLKKLKAFVLNHTHNDLSEEELQTTFAQEALEQKESSAEAIKSVIDAKFGEDAVVYDMSDIEANKKAFADERQVISGSQLSKEAWSRVREAREQYSDFALPSGQISKYAKPEFTSGAEEVDVDDKMQEVVDYAKFLHQQLGFGSLSVTVHDGSGALASYGRGNLQLFFNVLGRQWFDLDTNKQEILELLIHEFGHYYSSDHLSRSYYDGLCRIGAKLTILKV
jgi:hypothetical protein